MDPQRVASIKQQLSMRPTEELVEIWRVHDRDAWTEEAFEAIRQILHARKEALPAYEDRDSADQHIDLAQKYIDQDQLDLALAECQLAVEASPHYAYSYDALGVVLEELLKWDDAVSAYQEAINLDPHLRDARRGLKHSLREQSRQQEIQALSEYEKNMAEENIDPSQIFLDEVVATDETAILRGWPGYRTRPGRSGLDYIDTTAEESHMEGMLLRLLITGRLRTKNPFYWLLMVLGAVFCLFPCIFLIGSIGSYNAYTCIFSVFYVPIGILLLYNLGGSIFSKKVPADDDEEDQENEEPRDQ